MSNFVLGKCFLIFSLNNKFRGERHRLLANLQYYWNVKIYCFHICCFTFTSSLWRTRRCFANSWSDCFCWRHTTRGFRRLHCRLSRSHCRFINVLIVTKLKHLVTVTLNFTVSKHKFCQAMPRSFFVLYQIEYAAVRLWRYRFSNVHGNAFFYRKL